MSEAGALLTDNDVTANAVPPSKSPTISPRENGKRRVLVFASGDCRSSVAFSPSRNSGGGALRKRWRKSSFIAATHVSVPSGTQGLDEAVKDRADVRLTEAGELGDEAIVE